MSITMLARTPHFRAMLHTPTAAPTLSRSAKRWPMTKTLLESRMISARVLAMTRDLTLLRLSTSSPRPPKNSKLSLSFITVWSPPREIASSMAISANESASLRLVASTPKPMLTVASTPLGLSTSCISSVMRNLSSFICSISCFSKMTR